MCHHQQTDAAHPRTLIECGSPSRTIPRASYSLTVPVFADGLSNGKDMRLGKRRVRTGAAMPACAEADELVRVGGIGLSFVEGSFEPADVDQKIHWCGFACVGMYAHGEEG